MSFTGIASLLLSAGCMGRCLTSQFVGDGGHVLNLELPAPPAALVRMMTLLAEPSCDLDSLSELIESDMALAAALLKTVNSSLFNLSGRIQTVRQAINYLGFREVGGITLRHGLSAAFPQSPELDRLWQRAAARSALMGVLGQSLGFDAWAAHSAGLFEECGKALLFRHAAPRYRPLWASASTDDGALAVLELQAFGASHDIVGAALCETWGLQPAAVRSVRHHVQFQATLELPRQEGHRAICAVSVLAHRVMNLPADLERCIQILAPQLEIAPEKIWAVIPSGPHRLAAPR